MSRIFNSLSNKIKSIGEKLEKGILLIFRDQTKEQHKNFINSINFKKVNCYDIPDKTKKFIHKEYKILEENEINKLISLNTLQMKKIAIHISESLDEYKRGEIFISNEDLIKYQTLYDFLLIQKKNIIKSDLIRKDLIDFIVRDMQKCQIYKRIRVSNNKNKEFKFYDEDI